MEKGLSIAVIPARYQASRLPGKPLADIAGKSLIQRVWEQTRLAKFIDRVIIATDSERIHQAAGGFGAEVMMTSSEHRSGSDRSAEVLRRLQQEGTEVSCLVNVQGDMPFINPAVIDSTISALEAAGSEAGVATVATPILSEGEFLEPSAVKVVLDSHSNALYFSRAAIPYWREKDYTAISRDIPFGYKHMGLYVYRPEVLQLITALEQPLTEQREKLEQLRVLSHGIKIRVIVVSKEMIAPSIEVDTPVDLERARKYCADFDM